MNGLEMESEQLWAWCPDRDKEYTLKEAMSVICVYLSRNSYEEAIRWTFLLIDGYQNPTLYFVRFYICVKMSKCVRTPMMENIRHRFENISHQSPAILFYMADLEFMYGDYKRCSVLVFKIDQSETYRFDFQLKRLCFDLMWKQQVPQKWIFVNMENVPTPPVLFCNAVHHMRLHNFRRAIELFEQFLVEYSLFITNTVLYEAETMLSECYERVDEIIGDMSYRFHLCGQCNNYIDREPLWKRDTDCFICSVCEVVPYCSVECHDKHWPVHRKVCGQKYDKKRVTMFPNLGETICSECFAVRPGKVCTRCNNAFYCDETCQKKHWSNHKVVCAKSNSTGK